MSEYKLIESSKLKQCIEYKGITPLFQCLRENKRKVAVAGLSCSGKSTLLRELIPEYDNIYKGEDEERWDLPITTTNIDLETNKHIITDVIIATRHPREILKCMIENDMETKYKGEYTPIKDIPEIEALRTIANSQSKIIEEATTLGKTVLIKKSS